MKAAGGSIKKPGPSGAVAAVTLWPLSRLLDEPDGSGGALTTMVTPHQTRAAMAATINMAVLWRMYIWVSFLCFIIRRINLGLGY